MLRKNFPHRVKQKRELALKQRYKDLEKLKDRSDESGMLAKTRIATEITNLTAKIGHQKETLGITP